MHLFNYFESKFKRTKLNLLSISHYSGLSTWGKRVGRKLDQIKQLGDSSEKLQYVVTPTSSGVVGVVGSSSQPCSPLPPKCANKTLQNSETSSSRDLEGDFANQLKEHLNKLDVLPPPSTDKQSNDIEFFNGSKGSISRNSTLRGCPSRMTFPESDTVSHESAPVSSRIVANVQSEISLRQHKKQTSRASHGIQTSEDNKLWLSREFPEIAIRQNESKSQTTRKDAATNSSPVKRRVSRVESLRNLFFNRGSTNNGISSSNVVGNTSGGAAGKRRFLLKKRARSAEKEMLASGATAKVIFMLKLFNC